MKNFKLFILLCVAILLMQSQTIDASMLVDYYRLPPTQREKVIHDQAAWKAFENHLTIDQTKAMTKALSQLKLDGLSKEERMVKINSTIKQNRDPADFDMEKDWHAIAYLLTGDASLKEENITNAPLHNVIFGGLKAPVETGYGSVRYFDAKLVAEIATALASADRKVIAARYDPEVMKKLNIYASPEADEKKGILQLIEDLTAFFQKAAANHEDVITFVS
jgi:hypothetical protein